MQNTDLDGKIELELIGRFLPDLLDSFLEKNPDIILNNKKTIDQEGLSIYYISFPHKSSLKVSNLLTKAEDSLGYSADVYFKVLEGNFPEKPFGPFRPIKKRVA